MDRQTAASFIDHTLLKADATRPAIVRLCAEAREFGFAAVCVNPYWIPVAAQALTGSKVALASVCGFPLGAHASSIKAAEAARAIADGATEIDMVINVGELIAGNEQFVQDDIQTVVEVAHRGNAHVKVILETCLLNDVQKAAACRAAQHAGADFVKTSTGFGTGGATTADVRLMRAAVGQGMGVKASGGIRSVEDFHAMIAAGANRVGTSSGIAIVNAIPAQGIF
jgi:deoxyribose-phosphate aldolase